MPHGAVRVPGKYRDGGVLIAFTVFAAEIVLEDIARTGAEQAQVMPASPASVRAHKGQIRSRHDGEIDLPRDVVGDAIVTIDPKRAHGARAGLPLTVHEVVDHQRAIRSGK